MSVRLDGEVIHLDGNCQVEEAETLVSLLSEGIDRPVDISACRRMHAAVLQALLTLAPIIQGRPADPFLSTWIVPLLRKPQSLDPVEVGQEDGDCGRQPNTGREGRSEN